MGTDFAGRNTIGKLVKLIKGDLLRKQDSVSGSEGDILSFDEFGKLIASKRLTEAERKIQNAVTGFNGRGGDVVPTSGDYTAEMVGAAPVEHSHTAYASKDHHHDDAYAPRNHTHTAEDVGAAPKDHNHDGLYYRKTETMSTNEIQEAIEAVKEGGGFSKIRLAAPTGISFTNLDEGCTIKWTDPDNVTISGSTGVLAQWSGTVVVRKVGSAPTSKTDGTIVVDSKVRDQYKTTGFKDTGLTNGTKYYYGIFPYSTDLVYTTDSVTTFTPSEILPTAASGISITNLDESCKVTYTKPSDATSVKIVYKAGSAPSSPTDAAATSVASASSPTTITGLTNGTKYYFVVYTFNAKRYKAAATVQFTPAAIYPSAATGISIENGILQAKVYFTKPSDATSVKIVYKAGSDPTSPTDGTSVTASTSPTTISGLVDKTTYYFVVYTYNAKRYKAASAVSIVARQAEHYAFTISDAESACKSKITYPSGVDNSNFAAAGMGTTFSYGGWANAFFIKKLKVVMLNFDGTEAYEINKDNYKQKAAGGTVGTEGNVMVAIPKTYIKVVDNGNNTATVHVSDMALDSDYKCWAHIGLDGTEKDYCYMAVYDPCNESSKLRSLTGKTPLVSATGANEITWATANNVGSEQHWYTGVAVDRLLIQLLLLLIGKNTNGQEQFGKGVTSASAKVNTGTMDDKGLFWGDQTGTNGVKVFGIEHFWGNIWHRIAGWMNISGKHKMKFTHGTQDGSTVTGYNTTGNGYLDMGTCPTSSFWIKTMYFSKFGLIPKAGAGSETTDYADYCYSASGTYYALVGGAWSAGGRAGPFYVSLAYAV
ncbi:MAG: hypothetical protein NC131_14350, partial [Roseburia sp.]|nr:hypothetical protein [Roseburia sp.]